MNMPHGWITSPRLSDADLTGSFWRLSAPGEVILSPFLVLAPGGLLGNFRQQDQDSWAVLDGKLSFISTRGVVTTTYDMALIEDGEVVALAGHSRSKNSDSWYELRRTTHPVHPLHPSPPDANRTANFVTTLASPTRRNLVVLRAGSQSLHVAWPRDIADTDRNWDFCISYYGTDPGELGEQPDYLTHQPDQRKYQALYDLFYPKSPLWAYDQIWFPDDDLMITWGDINQMFHDSQTFGLDLCQPSLMQRPDCYITHNITAQQTTTIMRYTAFVEIMCPLFSLRALRICVGSFRDSVSGFGLDSLFPALLGWPRNRIGILDTVGLVHTRPLGRNYDPIKAGAEERAMLSSYKLHWLRFPATDVKK
jgi:hypothetical protein